MTAVQSIGRKLWVHLTVFYGLMVAYRGEIALWAIATSLPLIMMGVWTEAAKSGGFPLNEVEMARYFLAVYLVRQFTIVWVIYDFEWNVVTGRLTQHLLRPVDPNWNFFVPHLSEQACRLPFVIALVGLCYFLFPHAFHGAEEVGAWWSSDGPGLGGVLLGGLAVYAALLCRYFLQYAISMLGFWLERVGRVDELAMIPFMFFSGMLFPLEVLEARFPWVHEVAMWTPFPWMLWFPAKLISEGVASVPVAQGFLVLGGWTVVLWALQRGLWRLGVKQYSAMGA